MMKNIFIIIFSLVALFSNAQNLTLDELITLRKKDLTEIKHYLTKKNWEFSLYQKGYDEEPTIYEFEYGARYKSQFGYLICADNNIRVTMTTLSDEVADKYVERMLSFNPKIVKNKQIDSLRFYNIVYQGATTTLDMKMILLPGTGVFHYVFTIMSNQDYNTNMK